MPRRFVGNIYNLQKFITDETNALTVAFLHQSHLSSHLISDSLRKYLPHLIYRQYFFDSLELLKQIIKKFVKGSFNSPVYASFGEYELLEKLGSRFHRSIPGLGLGLGLGLGYEPSLSNVPCARVENVWQGGSIKSVSF